MEDVEGLTEQAEELRGRLRGNEWFLSLNASVQKRCLAGDNLMIANRDEMLEKAAWDKKIFMQTGIFYLNMRTSFQFRFIEWSQTAAALASKTIQTKPISP